MVGISGRDGPQKSENDHKHGNNLEKRGYIKHTHAQTHKIGYLGRNHRDE